MKMRLNANNILVTICLIGLFLPSEFVGFFSLGMPVKVICYCGLFYAVIYEIKEKLYFKENFMLIHLWFFWMGLATVLNTGSLHSAIQFIYPLLSVLVLTYFLSQSRPYDYIKYISLIFSVMLLANLITFFQGGLYDNDIYYKAYFFGIRVNISEILVFAYAISLISAYIGGRKERLICLVGIFSGVYFIIAEWVSTAILSSVIFAAIILISILTKSFPGQRKFIWFFGIVLMIAVGLFVLNPDVNRFSWVVEDMLGESLTMTGRTELWSSAIEQLDGIHWIIGNGFNHGIRFVTSNGFSATTAHSQYINILFNFGLIGIFIYIALYVSMLRKFMRIKDFFTRSVVIAVFFATIVMGISTTTYHTVYFYVWYVICMNLDENTQIKQIARRRGG